MLCAQEMIRKSVLEVWSRIRLRNGTHSEHNYIFGKAEDHVKGRSTLDKGLEFQMKVFKLDNLNLYC